MKRAFSFLIFVVVLLLTVGGFCEENHIELHGWLFLVPRSEL